MRWWLQPGGPSGAEWPEYDLAVGPPPPRVRRGLLKPPFGLWSQERSVMRAQVRGRLLALTCPRLRPQGQRHGKRPCCRDVGECLTVALAELEEGDDDAT